MSDTSGLVRFLAVGLLACGVAAFYAIASQGNDFVYDDHEVIVFQPRPATWVDVVAVFAEPHFLGLPYYRPVTRATLLGQKALHGDRPDAFRAVNALLMAAAAAFAYAILVSPGLAVRHTPALLGAALFAVHPIASSCVYPIASGRETLLPVVLILAAMLSYLRGRRVVAFGCFAAALFSKEQAIVVPLLFVCADLFGVAPDPPRQLRGWLIRHAPSGFIVGLYLLCRYAVLGPAQQGLALGEGIATSFLSYGFALQTAIVPFAELLYEPELHVWLSTIRLLVVAVVLILCAFVVRRAGAPSAGLLGFWAAWFVIAQLPTANLLRQEAPFAERYTFLSLLAFSGVAGAALSALWESRRVRGAVVAAGITMFVVLAALSAGRAAYFRDDEVFARQWLRSNPDSPEALHLIGLMLADQGDLDGAIANYEASRVRSRRPAEVLNNLGAALAQQGRAFAAEAALEEALRLRPDHPEAHVNLGSILAARGAFDEAIAHYRSAVEIAPRLASAHNNLGTALARNGELDQARWHLEEALRLKPDYADAARNLAIVRARQQELR